MITLLAASPEPEPRPRVTRGGPTAYGADSVPIEAGRLAHHLIAQSITVEDPAAADVVAAAKAEATTDPLLKNLNRRRIAMIAGTAAAVYLRQLRPSLATVIQAEIALTSSRPDLAFRYFDAFFFDEVKTGRSTHVAWHRAQVCRELRDGHAMWGHDFVGVRLVHVHNPSASLLVTRSGSFRLADTPLAFDHLRRDEASS